MIKSMYYLCKEYHRVASVPAIILFILTDVSLTQNVFMIYMCLVFEIIMYFKGWIKEIPRLRLSLSVSLVLAISGTPMALFASSPTLPCA